MTVSLLRKHIPECCWAWVIEFSLLATVKLGLFAAGSCNPSIILLEMLMPDMDGVDVLRTLKQTQSTTDIPVLIISSVSEKNGEKLIQEGAAGYFEKGSMTPEKLENAISGILKKRLLVP
jgi:CheY-like chemotaxis protein